MDNLLFKSGNNGQVNVDQAQGIVECFVAGIGNKDSVGDIVISGAFAKSLAHRKPRVVWGHSWNDPIGKVLEMYEVPIGDSRLPAKMRNAGIGGLYAKVQFNLQSEKGKEAFSTVAFFGEDQEWSIGYKTIDSVFDQNLQANILKEVELYEVSPVLHGANQLTGTISIKADEKGQMPIIPMHGMGMPMMPQVPRIVVVAAPQGGADESSEGDPFAEGMSQELSEPDKNALQAELAERTGSKIEILSATENSVVFRRTTTDGQASMYRLPYHREGNQYMFGKPEPYAVEAPKPQPMQNIEQKPGAPVVVPNGGIAYRNDDQQEMLTMFGGSVESPFGKSEISHLIELPESYMASARDFVNPVLRHHKLVGRPSAKGIIIDGVLTANALDALQNAVKALGATIGQAGGNIGQAIGKIRDLAQTFNPYALDGDGDGFVQDGSAFQRPYIPIKKPGFDLPDVRGRKRSGDKLLDKPRPTSALPKDRKKWTPAQRQEALLGGLIEPETREDVAFLANKRPENEGIAKYWDMSEADLTKEGNKLINARKQSAGTEKEKIDEELLKVSHEFQRRASYAETFGQDFVPPAKRETPKPDLVPVDITQNESIRRMLGAPKSNIPRTDEGFASRYDQYVDKFDALIEQMELDPSAKWSDLDEDSQIEFIKDLDYDYMYDVHGNLGDDGIVEAMESGQYDDEIAEFAEDVWNTIGKEKKLAADKERRELAREEAEDPRNIADAEEAARIEREELEYERTERFRPSMAELAMEAEAEDEIDGALERYAGELPFDEDDDDPDAWEEQWGPSSPMDNAGEDYVELDQDEDRMRGLASRGQDVAWGELTNEEQFLVEQEYFENMGGPRPGDRDFDSSAAQNYYEQNPDMWDFSARGVPDFELPLAREEDFAFIPFGFASRDDDGEVKQSKLDEMVEDVRTKLIAELETADPATWKPSWRNDSLPVNPTTGKPYRGFNAFWLMLRTSNENYSTGRFAGFNQLKARGAQVRKGEKGVPILRPQLVKKTDDDGNIKEFVVFRGTTVFNIDQADGGDEALRAIPADLPEEQRIKILEATIADLGVNVVTDNMRGPHYSPTGDYVSMPDFSKGTGALEWNSSLAHETIHWTGGASRLNRPSVANYSNDSKTRAYEELVAEIGSAMFLAAHGIDAPFREDHAPYIKGWISLLKDDPDALSRAFKDATAAINHILEKSPNLRKLFGGSDGGKKAPEVDAPNLVGAAVNSSEGFASLHRVRTPRSKALGGILYDDSSRELMVGFLKGKSWDDASPRDRDTFIDRAEAILTDGNRSPSASQINDYAEELYDDARDIGWYVYSDVDMTEVEELAIARSKGKHINALKKLKKARKATDEDQFNFFGRDERIQDVASSKMNDGFASRGPREPQEGLRRHKLMPAEIRGKIPKLDSTEEVPTDEKILAVKFFSPYSNWTWYGVEFDGEDMFFGYVEGFENEWGYFSLDELAKTQLGGMVPAVERDTSFRPIKFGDLNKADGFASTGGKRLGIEPNYADPTWVDKTQQRILRQNTDWGSLSYDDQIDWANSFLQEFIEENDMGHDLTDLMNGRRLDTRPDIGLLNYAESAYARMSDAHMARRAQFGEEDGFASVGNRTRRLGIQPSKAVDYVAYDPESESLFVAYKREDGRGDMYVYEGVSMDDAIALENAPSAGRAINDIKRRKNVRKATPEEVVGLSESDRKEGNALKRRKAINTIDAIYASNEHRKNRNLQLEINADRISVEDDGTTTWESSDDTMRYTISPSKDGGYLVTAEKLSRGGREEPDTFDTVFSSKENSQEDAIAALFNAAKAKIADDDAEAKLDRELADITRELDMAGDAPGVESIDVTYSSALTAVDYNPATKEMRVSYNGGGTYIYEGVDADELEAFKRAPSKGRAINDIKRAHPFRQDSEWTGGGDEDGDIEEFDVSGSAAVEQVAYDPEKEDLMVIYSGGKGYVYTGVTREEADAVRSASSKGRAINDVKRTHEVRKLTGEDVRFFGSKKVGELTPDEIRDDKELDADELRVFIDEQEGLLEVMRLNGESSDKLARQKTIIDNAKRDLLASDPAPTAKPKMLTSKPPRGGKRVRNRNVTIAMEQGKLDEIIEAEGKKITVDQLRDAAGSPMGKYTKGPRKGKNRGFDTITVRDAETGELLHANEILLTSSATPRYPSAASRKRGYIRARSYAGRQGHNILSDEGPSLRGEGRGMTDYDKRVYGLGSDEKNREVGLASRGYPINENDIEELGDTPEVSPADRAAFDSLSPEEQARRIRETVGRDDIDARERAIDNYANEWRFMEFDGVAGDDFGLGDDDDISDEDGFASTGGRVRERGSRVGEDINDFRRYLDSEYGEYFMEYTQMDDEELKQTLMTRYRMSRGEARDLARQIRRDEKYYYDLWEQEDLRLNDLDALGYDGDDGFASRGLNAVERDRLNEAMQRPVTGSRSIEYEADGGKEYFEVGEGPRSLEIAVNVENASRLDGKDFVGSTVTFADGRRGVVVEGYGPDIYLPDSVSYDRYGEPSDEPRFVGGLVRVAVTHDKNGPIAKPYILESAKFDLENDDGDFRIVDATSGSGPNNTPDAANDEATIDDTDEVGADLVEAIRNAATTDGDGFASRSGVIQPNEMPKKPLVVQEEWIDFDELDAEAQDRIIRGSDKDRDTTIEQWDDDARAARAEAAESLLREIDDLWRKDADADNPFQRNGNLAYAEELIKNTDYVSSFDLAEAQNIVDGVRKRFNARPQEVFYWEWDELSDSQKADVERDYAEFLGGDVSQDSIDDEELKDFYDQNTESFNFSYTLADGDGFASGMPGDGERLMRGANRDFTAEEFSPSEYRMAMSGLKKAREGTREITMNEHKAIKKLAGLYRARSSTTPQQQEAINDLMKDVNKYQMGQLGWFGGSDGFASRGDGFASRGMPDWFDQTSYEYPWEELSDGQQEDVMDAVGQQYVYEELGLGDDEGIDWLESNYDDDGLREFAQTQYEKAQQDRLAQDIDAYDAQQDGRLDGFASRTKPNTNNMGYGPMDDEYWTVSNNGKRLTGTDAERNTKWIINLNDQGEYEVYGIFDLGSDESFTYDFGVDESYDRLEDAKRFVENFEEDDEDFQPSDSDIFAEQEMMDDFRDSDGFASGPSRIRPIPRSNTFPMSVQKERGTGYITVSAMVTGGRGASEEDRGTRRMQITFSGGSPTEAKRNFLYEMDDRGLVFAGEDGFASQGGRLGPPPDDAEYGRELAAQRARDRAAGRNATNPIGRGGDADGFASSVSDFATDVPPERRAIEFKYRDLDKSDIDDEMRDAIDDFFGDQEKYELVYGEITDEDWAEVYSEYGGDQGRDIGESYYYTEDDFLEAIIGNRTYDDFDYARMFNQLGDDNREIFYEDNLIEPKLNSNYKPDGFASRGGRMKASKEQLDKLRNAIAPLDTQERRARYLRGDYPRSESTRDLDVRYAFDLLWEAIDTGDLSYSDIANLNDAQTATALRNVVPKLVRSNADGFASRDSDLLPISEALRRSQPPDFTPEDKQKILMRVRDTPEFQDLMEIQEILDGYVARGRTRRSMPDLDKREIAANRALQARRNDIIEQMIARGEITRPKRKEDDRSDGFASRGFVDEIDVSGSTAVERVSYDPDKEELLVVYEGGNGYIYSGVTPEEVAGLKNAPSKGRAINEIKRTHDVRKTEPVADGLELSEREYNFARLKPEEQNTYFQRALANNADSGLSSDAILDEAKKLAMDDREMAQLERQAIGMGASSEPRKIDVSSSSALNYVAYDEKNRLLDVEYRGRDGKGTGTLYRYQGVEPDVVDRIEASDSRGATMREVRDNYEFTTSRRLPDSAYEGLASRSEKDRLNAWKPVRQDLRNLRDRVNGNEINDGLVGVGDMDVKPGSAFFRGRQRAYMGLMDELDVIIANAREEGNLDLVGPTDKSRARFESLVNAGKWVQARDHMVGEIARVRERAPDSAEGLASRGGAAEAERVKSLPVRGEGASLSWETSDRSGIVSATGQNEGTHYLIRPPYQGDGTYSVEEPSRRKDRNDRRFLGKSETLDGAKQLAQDAEDARVRKTKEKEAVDISDLIDRYRKERGETDKSRLAALQQLGFSIQELNRNGKAIQFNYNGKLRTVDIDSSMYSGSKYDYDGGGRGIKLAGFDRESNGDRNFFLSKLDPTLDDSEESIFKAEEKNSNELFGDDPRAMPDGFASRGSRRSTREMSREFDKIEVLDSTLNQMDPTEAEEYREQLINARNQAALEMVKANGLDPKKIDSMYDVSTDEDDLTLLEKYDMAIDDADERLESLRTVRSMAEAKQSASSYAWGESEDLYTTIRNGFIPPRSYFDSDEEFIESLRDNHDSLLRDVKNFVLENSEGESSDGLQKYTLEHDTYLSSDNNNLLKGLQKRIDSAKTEKEFDVIRRDMEGIMGDLVESHEQRYREDEANYDYDVPGVTDDDELKPSKLATFLKDQDAESYFVGFPSRGDGFASRESLPKPERLRSRPSRFYPNEDEREKRTGGAGAPGGPPPPPDDDDDDSSDGGGFASMDSDDYELFYDDERRPRRTSRRFASNSEYGEDNEEAANMRRRDDGDGFASMYPKDELGLEQFINQQELELEDYTAASKADPIKYPPSGIESTKKRIATAKRDLARIQKNKPKPAEEDEEFLESIDGFASRGGKRPKSRWSAADRQRFADGNILRSRKRPSKRRQGPSVNEFDGFASRAIDELPDTDTPFSRVPFEGGEHGPGKDFSLRKMWENYEKINGRTRWLSPEISIEEIAEFLGVDKNLAAKLLQARDPKSPELFIDDPYLAEKLNRKLGPDDDVTLFGFMPLGYYDNEGNLSNVDSDQDFENAVEMERARRTARIAAREGRKVGKSNLIRGGATIKDLEDALKKINPDIKLTDDDGAPLTPGAMKKAIDALDIEIPWSAETYRKIQREGGALSTNMINYLVKRDILDSSFAENQDLSIGQALQWPGFAEFSASQIIDAMSKTLGLSREEINARRRTIEEALANSRSNRVRAISQSNLRTAMLKLTREKIAKMVESLGLSAEDFEKWASTAELAK